jgi:molybdopterin synthase sulfur carrier subunit
MSEVRTRRVKLLYFAWVREKVGAREEIICPDVRPLPTGRLAQSRGPQFDEAFARPELIRAAVDKVHVKPAAAIAEAREIAFFPPVSGG